MQVLLATLESIGIFLAGMAVRAGLLLLVLGVLTVLFMAGLAVYRAVEAARRRAQGVTWVNGLLYQSGPYYAPGHTWLVPAGAGVIKVGVDDLAQRLFPGLCRVSLPAPGTVLREGEPAVELCCGNKRATIAAPVDGKVVAVNDTARRDPSLIRRDPYHRGWLLQLEVASDSYSRLPAGEAARAWMNREAARLTSFLEQQLSFATADGGELIAPGPALLTDEQWRAMTREFLASRE